MKYGIVENGIITFIRKVNKPGLVPLPDDAEVGMIEHEGKYYPPVQISDTKTVPDCLVEKKEDGSLFEQYNLTKKDGIYKGNVKKSNELLKNKRVEDRLNDMQKVFMLKAIEIKALACDKKGTPEYINEQYQIYINMYDNAKAGRYSDLENTEIITAHEKAKVAAASLSKEVNDIRSIFEKKIIDDEDICDLVKEFDEIVLSFTDMLPLTNLKAKL